MAMPNNAMNPTAAEMLNGMPRSARAKIPPTAAKGTLKKISAGDVQAKQTVGQPYLRVVVNRDAIARHGFNATQVLDLVEALGVRTVGTMKDGDDRYNIRVRLAPQDRDSILRIRSLRVNNGAGVSVALGDLADISWEPGPAQIEREQGKRVIKVQANVRARPLASFVTDAQQAVAAYVHLPPGYTISWD